MVLFLTYLGPVDIQPPLATLAHHPLRGYPPSGSPIFLKYVQY